MTSVEPPRRVPRPNWTPLPRAGCRNVEVQVLLHDEQLALALLRFRPNGTIDEHAAGHETDVICLEGSGYTSIDSAVYPLREGESIRWPVGRPHRLWTVDDSMLTLMVQRLA